MATAASPLPPARWIPGSSRQPLATGVEYYTDRDYTVTGVPGAYVGMDMIKTPNDERNLTVQAIM